MNEDYTDFGYSGDGTAEDLVRWGLDNFHPRIALACSFQTTVLVDMVMKVRKDARIIAVDTGRLPEETYECARDIERRYATRIEWYHPQAAPLEDLTRTKGQFSFRESVENRRECCFIRKIEPLNRALTTVDAWFSGIRREQSAHRSGSGKIERDSGHGGIVKINPIADWTWDQVLEYVKKHKLPYNRLLDKGYASIGCACCTRPVEEGAPARTGRWWWEDEEHKECGIHVRNWNI